MTFKRVVAVVVSLACVASAQPGLRARAPQQPPPLTIAGTVFESDGATPAPNIPVQLRNLDKGTIVGRAVSDRNGAFSFAVSDPGRYLVEALKNNGGVRAVSNPVTFVKPGVTANVILASYREALTTLVAVVSGAGLAGWIVSKNGTTSPER